MTYDWQQYTYFKIRLIDGSELTTTNSCVMTREFSNDQSWVKFNDIGGNLIILNMDLVVYIKQINPTGKIYTS